MFASNPIPVVIVGAGPTGLAAGNLLGMAGVPTLIIERNKAVSAIPKAIALDDEGMRICQVMGLSGAMSNCILSDLSVECVSGERLLARVVPRSGRNGHPLISTFYQPEFEAVLLDGLRRFPCVEARFQHAVEALEQNAESIIVSIRTPEGALERVRCEYLLACDGGKSSVRNALNIPLRGTTFAQRWLVIDAFCSETMENTTLPVVIDGQGEGRRTAGRGSADDGEGPRTAARGPTDDGEGRRTAARGSADDGEGRRTAARVRMSWMSIKARTIDDGEGRRTPARGLAADGEGRRTPTRVPAAATPPPVSLQERGSGECVTIFCDPGRPVVAIPGPNGYRRWEFMLLPGETEGDMLEPATISALLEQYSSPQLGRKDGIHRVHEGSQLRVVRQVVYTFHAAWANNFSRGRAFLLGDAAHMMPPFGGQGLNSGLRDAYNLAWKVAMVLQKRAALQLLATYHEERSGHAVRMVTFASLLGTLFMSKSGLLVYCRNFLIRMLYNLPITRTYLMEMRVKPQARYKAGFFVGAGAGKRPGLSSREERWRVFKWQKKSMVGSLLPQPEVVTQQGQRVLLDEVLGTGFALLRCHPDPEEAFASVETGFWEKLGVRFVCIQSDEAPKKSRKTQHFRRADAPREDGESHLPQALPVVAVRSIDKDFLSKSQGRFVVVRPDRFILGTFKEDKADAFVSAFQRLLSASEGRP